MNTSQGNTKSSFSDAPLINEKFGRSATSQLEEEFKRNTVGLVSKDEYKRRLRNLYLDQGQTKPDSNKKPEKKKEAKTSDQSKKKTILSFEDDFDNDDKETEEPAPQKKRNIGKNPNVDTSFLPDKERQEKLAEIRLKMSEDFLKEQEEKKEHYFEVKYTLWNGLNNVKTMKVKKYTTVGSFLDHSKKELDKEDFDIKQITIEGLMFVIDDKIIPWGYTFYELIASKAKGERGLLLDEKKKEGENNVYEQTTKPCKIVDKRVYDKQKHIFPCNTWKTLDFATVEE